MAIHPSQILVHVGGNALKLYGTPSRRTTPVARRGEDVIETFNRASTGTYIDANGGIKLAETNGLRVNMVDLDGDGVRETPAFLLEASRTNVCLRAQEIENAAWSDLGTPVVTANDAVAPDGTTTADKIDDNDGVALESRRQDVTVANDSTTWCVSVFVKKAPAGAPVIELFMQFNNGTPILARFFVDPINGASIADGGVVKSGVDDHGTYWRVWMTLANNSSGNTSVRMRLSPAGRLTGDVSTAAVDTSATGSNHFWGAQIENSAAPTSYVATVGSTVARVAEKLSFPFHAQPQAMTIYARLVERGTIAAVARVMNISNPGGGTAELRIDVNSGYRIRHRTADGDVNAQTGITPAIGDTVELVAQLNADGSVRMIQSLNGAAITTTAKSSALTLASAWSDQLLFVNSVDTAGVGFNEFPDLALFVGVHPIADCRVATQQ